MPHPDTAGVVPYLTRVQARALLCRYVPDPVADTMLDHPELATAPWPGRSGERLWRATDIAGLCAILAEAVARGRRAGRAAARRRARVWRR